MSNLQLHYTREEVLATDPIDEPLVLADVRCHGGYLDGQYVNPRTRFRKPAIEAWRQHHTETFGTDILHAPLESWPDNYPNVAQTKLLLREGVREPVIASLTRIGIMEGFGAALGAMAVPDMQRFFAEDIAGTALDHLEKGLLEAHGRDEGGWAEEAGHKHMWFVVRDLAFENPLVEDQTELLAGRFGAAANSSADGDARRQRSERMFDDLDPALEALLGLSARVLFIECKAFHVFHWAQEVLSDTDLVAGEGKPAELVGYILSDEIPHVGYAEIALTEARDRTFVGLSGKHYPGSRIIGALWDRALASSIGVLEDQNRALALSEIERALAKHPLRDSILEEFRELGDRVTVTTEG